MNEVIVGGTSKSEKNGTEAAYNGSFGCKGLVHGRGRSKEGLGIPDQRSESYGPPPAWEKH